MNDSRLTPRQQLLAGAAIGAMALSGSIGASQAGRPRCEPASAGSPLGPIGLDLGRDAGPDLETIGNPGPGRGLPGGGPIGDHGASGPVPD
jgi:hypothetical protein